MYSLILVLSCQDCPRWDARWASLPFYPVRKCSPGMLMWAREGVAARVELVPGRMPFVPSEQMLGTCAPFHTPPPSSRVDSSAARKMPAQPTRAPSGLRSSPLQACLPSRAGMLARMQGDHFLEASWRKASREAAVAISFPL